jgi:putative endonuclease
MSFVYMIKDSANKLYVGVSENPEQRVKNHNSGRGAAFTKTGVFRIVFIEEYKTLHEARKRELQIKKWRREKKEFLIDQYLKRLETKLL